MRARLAAIAAPRDSDSPRLAKLRAVLRDQALMAHVTANVEQWPPLSEEQRETFAALLDRTANGPHGDGRPDGRARPRGRPTIGGAP